MDGPGGDLITWDEVEDAAEALDEEIAQVEEEILQAEVEEELSEEEAAAAPATPARRTSRAFALAATPALAYRVRSPPFALARTALILRTHRLALSASQSHPARPPCPRHPRTTTPPTVVALSA